MAVTMIIGLIVAIVELVITIKGKKATNKTAKKGKNLHIFADLKKAMENTKKRKAEVETETTAEAEAAV